LVAEDRTTIGSLSGIAATSSSDVWAVGDRIEHWDGRHWVVAPSPKLPALHGLSSVVAVSADEAWAVGGSTIERYRCR
jgi:hypothetical protein